MIRMDDRLHRWLDGEIADEQLPPELRREAERWRALLAERPDPGPAPAWLEQRVMAALPEHAPGPLARLAGWILRPQSVRVRPLTLAATAAAALVLVMAWPGERGTVVPRATVTSEARTADGGAYVQFLYVAPEAGAVAVAGDFNDWAADFRMEDPDGDGIWTGRMALEPGLHKYMFVVDGEWVTDPQAERYVDDGFGNRNALIEVPTTGGAT